MSTQIHLETRSDIPYVITWSAYVGFTCDHTIAYQNQQAFVYDLHMSHVSVMDNVLKTRENIDQEFFSEPFSIIRSINGPVLDLLVSAKESEMALQVKRGIAEQFQSWFSFQDSHVNVKELGMLNQRTRLYAASKKGTEIQITSSYDDSRVSYWAKNSKDSHESPWKVSSNNEAIFDENVWHRFCIEIIFYQIRGEFTSLWTRHFYLWKLVKY